MNIRSRALMEAKRLRFCLSADQYWGVLTSQLKRFAPKTLPLDDTAILPGQFRFIKTELGCWRNGRYYNPPLVFTLREYSEPFPHILSAQVYPEPDLAAPGDLILNTSQTELFPLIIESWNIYPVLSEHLNPPLGQILPELAEIVLQMHRNSNYLPAWGLAPRPMFPNDPRIEFRELEQTVSAVFTACPEAKIDNGDWEKLKNRLLALVPGLTWRQGAVDTASLLATAKFPDEYRLMAAADDETNSFTANLVSLRQGQVTDFRPVQGRILMCQSVPGGTGISGRILDLPKSTGISFLLAFLTSGQMDVLTPIETQWDADEGQFYLFFHAEEIVPDRLALAVLLQLD